MRKITSLMLVGLMVVSGFVAFINLVGEDVRAEIWSIETVDSAEGVGIWTSIAIDSNNHPHISYEDYINDDLKYAYWDGSQWQIERVVDGFVGEYTSIAIDSNNRPHISYPSGDLPIPSLKYTYWNGSFWQIGAVDITGEYPSIAIDSDNRPHISYSYYGTAYTDPPYDDLRYAYWDGSSWQIETVDGSAESPGGVGSVGEYTSIVLDSNNRPHISYYDWINIALKYAYYNGSNWQIETVDSDGDVGRYSSIALDSNDCPHISYSDWTNIALKYAYYNGSNWQIETVDSGSVGDYTSIAIDSNNRPHISYYDYFNDDLRYAYWDGSSWQIETVDGSAESPGSVGMCTSIALDSNNRPHISYYDLGNEGLKYAKMGGTSVTTPTAPQNPQASTGNGQITLTWSAPSSDGGSAITNYNIYRGTSAGGEIMLTTIGNVLTYTDTGVTNDQVYYYKVKAVNIVGEGAYSNEVQATPSTSGDGDGDEGGGTPGFEAIAVIAALAIALILLRKKK